MLFVVMGAHHATGAKTRLEIDATSRAAAEKAAERSGVEVLHCHAAHEDPLEHPRAGTNRRGEICEGGTCIKLWAIGGLVAAAMIIWIFLR